MASKKKPVVVPVTLDPIKAKFKELADIRKKLAENKALYQKHDQLMEELLPLFISVQPNQFVIQREITLGTDKFRLTPYFYDEKKGKVLAKVWKSTAFESSVIE